MFRGYPSLSALARKGLPSSELCHRALAARTWQKPHCVLTPGLANLCSVFLFVVCILMTAPSSAAIGDADNDGIPDSVELFNGRPVDTDLDGVPDYLDLDSDNDGYPDSVEGVADNNGNGIPDYIDFVSDGDADLDGIPDTVEGITDADGDSLANYLDRDADNDGLSDLDEVVNALDGVDSDRDGIPDFLDRDSDNDGISDAAESGSSDWNQDGKIDQFVDQDGDGQHDTASLSHSIGMDVDGDGFPNYLDLDADGDGKFDLLEIGGQDTDGDGRLDAWADSDEDGIPDYADADQFNAVDSDMDGIVDFADVDSYPSGLDTDEDGIENSFDLDSNQSGFINLQALEPSLGAALPDLDGDGQPDYLQSGSKAGKAAGGCSLTPASTHTTSIAVDPLLLLLVLLAFLQLAARTYARQT